jgi:uncharacterized protein
MQDHRVLSPYVAGIVIGLLQIPALLILGASIGTTGSFGALTCTFLDQGGDQGCFHHLKYWWQLGLVCGIFFGAYFSRRLSHQKRPAVSFVWNKILHTSRRWPRFIMAFMGGAIFLFGARLADGCTSGNGISGIALLSIGSFIVIGAMFLAGFFVTLLYPRN